MTAPKRVYVARRNPALSRAAFLDAWRAHHALGRRFPTLQHSYPRSAYCAVLDPAAGFDAVGMLWTRDAGVLEAPAAGPDAIATMRADERRVFAGNVFDAAMVVTEEHVLRPPPVQEGAGCVLAFLRGGAGSQWFGRVRATCAGVAAPGLEGIVVGEVGPGPTFRCDALAEFWFADAARAALGAPVLAGPLAACGGDPPLLLATEVCLAWPPPAPGA